MSERLLLIDRNGSYAAAIGESLEMGGYEIRIASDGNEALLGLRDWGPDLIVLDMVVSQMEGWEMFGRLCEGSGVPIIVLTDKRADRDSQKESCGNTDRPAGKALDVPLLLACVETMLRRG